jgi:outer membrane protein TolC
LRFVLLLLLVPALGAHAGESGTGLPGRDGTLTLETVLATSARYVPAVMQSLAERQGAAGRVTAAEGAFDLVFDGGGFDRTSGYYNGRRLGAEVVQPIGPFGASVFGGYDVSRGDFPTYEDEYYTNEGGRLKAGVLFSLLRDRTIDGRRFGIADARLALEAADLDVLLTRIGVQQRAIGAYWRWVAAGHQLQVYEDLLEIALVREEGLERQVQSGAIAAIALTENRQNITRRRALTVAADASFRQAANQLAFYYRHTDGQPLTPERSQLPSAIPTEGSDTGHPLVTPAELTAVLVRRPELRLLRTSMERAERRIALQENATQPRLDLRFEVKEPLGSVGEGGDSRDTSETIVGMTLSFPLQQRKARGTLAQSRAELEALRQERRSLEDQLEREMIDVLLELEAAREVAGLAALEVEQARVLMDAERRRFASGASDFFLVNIREQTAADAQIRFLQAELKRHVAQAEYDAATLNLPQLGLSNGL